jgi:hypothetical protein
MKPGQDGFTQVQGAPSSGQENLPAPPLIGAAYGFLWLCVLGFVLSVWRRGQKTERELEELRRKLAAHAAGGK